MRLFGKKREVIRTVEYDADKQKAVLKCSICNGEQIAGFKDKQTGKFTEVMLIKDKRDLDTFMEVYGLTEVSKEY